MPDAGDQPATASAVGGRRYCWLCAPFFFGLRNGPSACRPSGTAPRKSFGRPSVTTRSPASTCSSGDVMIVGRNAVTPYRGKPGGHLPDGAGSAVKSWPNAPLS